MRKKVDENTVVTLLQSLS